MKTKKLSKRTLFLFKKNERKLTNPLETSTSDPTCTTSTGTATSGLILF
ncbi:hypothetical protein ACS5PU_06880 [Pedobacter sp. GSP4]